MSQGEGVKGTIYLLHFDVPLSHAKHYLGWTAAIDFEARIRRHRQGTGARILAVLKQRGIGFQVARTWEDKDRHQERRWKARGKSWLCPLCIAEKENNVIQ